MTKFRILIAENKALVGDKTEYHLTQRGHQVVGIAKSYQEAVKLYLQEKPDITLLDIKLNGIKTGIDLAHFIRKQSPVKPFIFLTSQIDIQSINRAKETFPAAYLSKPVRKDSLYASIEIAMHKYAAKRETIPIISLFDGTSNYLIPLKDILYVQSDHIYLNVHIEGGKKIVERNTLKGFLDQLPKEQFIQTHRSFAVNLRRVNRWDNQNIYIENTKIPVSRARRKMVYMRLSNS
ncbi:MAG: LytR/AlgR family response regulator transcription factor [Chitinophagales bacterium]